jgi:hypothetical protein
MKNKGKENFNREGGTVDKDSIKKLISALTLSAMPAGEKGSATRTLIIAAHVPAWEASGSI